MNMRSFITLLERFEMTDHGRLLIDPRPNELMALFKQIVASERHGYEPDVRTLREDNRYYVWSAYEADHMEMARSIGVGQLDIPAEVSHSVLHWAESCKFNIERMHDGDWQGGVIVNGHKDFGYVHNEAGEPVQEFPD